MGTSFKCVLGFMGVIVIFSAILPYFFVHKNTSPGKSFEEMTKDAFVQQIPVAKAVRPPDYHMVFSSSCSDQQNWESYVLFYHAMRVKQPGTVTRIVSGCRPKEGKDLEEFHAKYIAPMAIKGTQSFHLHQTPSFSRVALEKGFPYKYMNKPFGLRSWMENELGLGWSSDNSTITSRDSVHHQRLLDGVVILIDPDMVLLRPITHDFSNPKILWAEDKEPKTRKVKHGHPISQQDRYISNEWMELDFKYITNTDTIKPPPQGEGPVHWNSGPPYLATVQDMYKIVSRWTETAPRVLEIFPHIFSEMYGYISASVMVDLPHSMTRSMVISETPASKDREGWSSIDNIPDNEVCAIARMATGTIGEAYQKLPHLPNVLHYCQRYLLGRFFFSKYRIKQNIMDCDKNLLLQPPLDIFPKFNFSIVPPRADLSDKDTYREEKESVPEKHVAKREAFMLCGMTNAVNEALRYYKQQACDSPNLNETYTVYDDPTDY